MRNYRTVMRRMWKAVIMRYLSGETEETHKKPQVMVTDLWDKYKAGVDCKLKNKIQQQW
jgi:hypothetical protein